MKHVSLLFLIFTVLAAPAVSAQETVSGQILFEGTPPPAEKVKVTSDMPSCGNTKEVRRLILGEGGGVANAVVTLHGAGGTPAPRGGYLDQVGCEFVPHVQILPLGSELTITSSDSVLHNAHGFYEDGSTAFNLAVPVVGMEVTANPKKTGVIKMRCDAGHTWMNAYIYVTDKPFAAVTDENGRFTFEGVPPGNYEAEVWHEWLGTKRVPVEIKENGEPLRITMEKE